MQYQPLMQPPRAENWIDGLFEARDLLVVELDRISYDPHPPYQAALEMALAHVEEVLSFLKLWVMPGEQDVVRCWSCGGLADVTWSEGGGRVTAICRDCGYNFGVKGVE